MASRKSTNQRYLDLVKRSVNQYLYLGGSETLSDYYVDADARYKNFEWLVPSACQPRSVLHRDQLDLLETLVLQVQERGVPGDFMEAGVWRGGAIILMLAIVEAYELDRNVIAADSFEGIPYSSSIKGDPVDTWPDRWKAGLEEVRETISRYNLLSEKLRFISGPFSETLSADSVGQLALVRLDADSYESTRLVLDRVYPSLSSGGVVLIDDWHLPGCVAAVLEYRNEHGIKSPVVEAGLNAFWVK